jgi:energy-coupling factor transporter transmembrane protein EcfT
LVVVLLLHVVLLLMHVIVIVGVRLLLLMLLKMYKGLPLVGLVVAVLSVVLQLHLLLLVAGLAYTGGHRAAIGGDAGAAAGGTTGRGALAIGVFAGARADWLPVAVASTSGLGDVVGGDVAFAAP